MSNLVSDELRLLVRQRADCLCEYCLLHEGDSLFTFQIDHVISVKHGGTAQLQNLALACIFCNRRKGSDIGTIRADGSFTRLFNPRSDIWAVHFTLSRARIEPATAIGEATARILRFNHPERVAERAELIARGRYPALQALARMRA